MRVLVTSTANTGHFTPLLAVLDALARRGDELLVVVGPGLLETVQGLGLPYVVGGEPPADELAAIWDRVPTVSRSEAAILVNREIFGRLDTAAMLPSVEAACEEWRPDVVVHEPAEFAGAVAAQRRGLPHVQVAIRLAGVEAASIDIAAPALARYGDGFVDALLASPYLSRFPESLDPSPFESTHRFREPAPPPAAPLNVGWPDEEAPLVYASLGTVAGRLPIGSELYPALGAALGGLRARVLLTTGRTRDPADAGVVADNVRVVAWVDQSAALQEAATVVCHGGAGTTFAALARGLPLVVVPLMADQFTNGRLVSSAGAGTVVLPTDETAGGLATFPARLREAAAGVLGTPSYRLAAERVAAEMAAVLTVDEVVADVVRPLAQ